MVGLLQYAEGGRGHVRTVFTVIAFTAGSSAESAKAFRRKLLWTLSSRTNDFHCAFADGTLVNVKRGDWREVFVVDDYFLCARTPFRTLLGHAVGVGVASICCTFT